MKLNNKTTIGICIFIIAALAVITLGFTGVRALLGMIIVFIIPFYLILDTLPMNQEEKIILGFFLGLGLFPVLVYWLGTIISFKLSIVITFIVWMGIAYIIRKRKQLPFWPKISH
tara:strand:- start:88 stop:432 length:345 start_codon:yes stop_codon:yes gene_type:complete